MKRTLSQVVITKKNKRDKQDLKLIQENRRNTKQYRLCINKDLLDSTETVSIDQVDFKVSKRNVYVTITVPRVSTHPLDSFFRAILTLEERGYANPTTNGLFKQNITKEISESMAAIGNLKRYLRSIGQIDLLKDESVLCLAVGDGNTPRTGYMIAGLTSWRTLSIDPEMKSKWVIESGIPHLTCHSSTIEQVDLASYLLNKTKIVVLGVHSHANLNDLWLRLLQFKLPLIAVVIPCCTGFCHTIEGLAPSVDLADSGIFSTKNQVQIYVS